MVNAMTFIMLLYNNGHSVLLPTLHLCKKVTMKALVYHGLDKKAWEEKRNRK